MSNEATRFRPGVSGNAGGSPRSSAVSALARRYTVDAVRALVDVARLSPGPSTTAPKVAAASKLIEIGYPGLQRGIVESMNVLQMHLLALQQTVDASENDLLSPEQAPEIEAGPDWDTPGALPTPDDSLPDDALPLWDSFRVRRQPVVDVDVEEEPSKEDK
jgi:hypothetical protein